MDNTELLHNSSSESQENGNSFKKIPVFETEDEETGLKKINLSKALLEEYRDRLFRLSGLEEIYKAITREISSVANVKYLFVENSTFSSAIGNNRLDAFTCVMDKGNGQFRKNVASYLKPVIAKLQERHHALLVHPDFCKSPQSARAYTSVLNPKELKFLGDAEKYEAEYLNLNADSSENAVPLDKVKDEEFNEEGVYSCNSNINIPYDNLESQSRKTKATSEPGQLHILNHSIYNRYFLAPRSDEEVPDVEGCQTVFLSIPVLSSSGSLDLDGENEEKNSEERFKGQGALFIFLVLRKNDEKISEEKFAQELDATIRQLALKLPRIVKTITFDYVFNIGLEKAKRAKNEAIKSAKAAIMARNMSHNIGSHVISYLNAHLSNVEAVLDIGAFNDIVKRTHSSDGRIKLQFTDSEQKGDFDDEMVQLPFLLGLGKFLGYLQERQDFIASIATDHIPPSSGVNLKDFVLDGFAWDSRQKRHGKEVKQYSNILLEYIAKSEGITREKLKIFFNNQDLDIPILADNSNVRGVNVALPGGIMGRQALYSIFENIIRNSAKHAKAEKNEFHLHIEVNEFNKFENYEFFRFSEGETKGKERQIEQVCLSDFKNYEDTYYSLIVRDHFGNANEETLTKVLEGVEKEMINADYSLNEQAKGLKEMKISAAWIRGKSVAAENERFPFLLAGRLKTTKEEALLYWIEDRKGKQVGKTFRSKEYITLLTEINQLQEQLSSLTQDEKKQLVPHLSFHILLPKSFKVIVISDKLSEEVKVLLKKHDWQVVSSWEVEKIQNLYSSIYILDSDLKEKLADAVYSFGVSDIKDSKERMVKLKKYKPIDFRANLFSKRMIEAKVTENTIENYLLKDGDGATEKLHDLFVYLYNKIININFNISTKDVLIKIEDKDKQVKEPMTALAKAQITQDLQKDLPGRSNLHEIYFGKHLKIKDLDTIREKSKAAFHYAESITGDNSTNRLLRSEDKDDMWFFKMAESALSQVLIIDERIWDDIVVPEKNKTLNIPDEKVKILRAKHIYIANLDIIAADNEKANLNITQPDNEKVGKKARLRSVNSDNKIEETFEITADKDTKKLVFKPLIDSKPQFSFLLIHQGLLDKLYTHLLPDYYGNITEFSNHFKGVKLIVHSGRSRPSREQLPTWVPFLSFSSVRFLLEDSKYALTEQLYAAHPLLI